MLVVFGREGISESIIVGWGKRAKALRELRDISYRSEAEIDTHPGLWKESQHVRMVAKALMPASTVWNNLLDRMEGEGHLRLPALRDRHMRINVENGLSPKHGFKRRLYIIK